MPISKRGGARKGAGRKKKWNEPRKVVRIPVSRVSEFEEWLKTSDNEEWHPIKDAPKNAKILVARIIKGKLRWAHQSKWSRFYEWEDINGVLDLAESYNEPTHWKRL